MNYGILSSAVSFLFPLYFLGLIAVAIPVLLHLKRRPPKEEMEFGSLMFLKKTPERTTRRRRLEHLLLLLLRCLALILLALAFGRPFLRSLRFPVANDAVTRSVILVDSSASMRRTGLREAAMAAAENEIARSTQGDEIVLARFDEQVGILSDFSTMATLSPPARVAMTRKLLESEDAAPSWLETDLGGAMLRAADLLLSADVEHPGRRREIVVISDFQAGARLDQLHKYPWPQEVKVRCVPVVPKEPGNLSIALAASPPRSRIDEDEVYRVRIAKSINSPDTKAVLSWKGHPETAMELLLAPGSSRIVRSPVRPPGADRGILMVEGDAQPFDNEVYIAPVQPRPLRILAPGKTEEADQAGTPLFYLSRALIPTPALQPILKVAEIPTDLVPGSTEIVLLTNQWSPKEGKTLHRFAEAGGLVVVALTAGTSPEAFTSLTGHGDWMIHEAETSAEKTEFSLLADLDFSHPVLEPFARAQIRDFTKIRFWKHRVLNLSDPLPEGVRVLATFDGKSPAMVEQRIGKGSIFLFLYGWQPQEGQLVLSSKFVPLLYSLFDHAGYSIRSAPTSHVGESSHAAPGFYEEKQSDGSTRLMTVNLDPNEGLTDPLDPISELSALSIPLVRESQQIASPDEVAPGQQLRIEAEQKEGQLKLWKWLVFTVLCILLLETWLGSRPVRLPSLS